ncbi:MAG: hypothetical protein P1V97_09485 [Planctomycetota bacterium]|nr:hypothetical protein [Planctomycetota bacterium]
MSRFLGWTKTERYDDFDEDLVFELNEDDFSNQKTKLHKWNETTQFEEEITGSDYPITSRLPRARSILNSPRPLERFSLAKIRQRLANPSLDAMAPARDYKGSWEQQIYW